MFWKKLSVLFYLIFVAEMFTAVNTRLKFIQEEGKEEYLKDFIEECKKSSMVKLITLENMDQKYFKLSNKMIIGVISKPQ